MPTLARNQASDCDNPELDLYIRIGAVPTNLHSLEFQILENVTTPGSPVQVYPATAGDRAPVNVADDCPVGDRLATGRYVARWTPPLTEVIGSHFIRWFLSVTVDSPEQESLEEFIVTAEATASSNEGYTTIQALRDEGVTEALASDARLQEKIELASMLVDRYTGRYFEPRSKVITVDGHGAPGLLLEEPIISISNVRILNADPFTSDFSTLELDDVRIYNRHLSQGLLDPDDRDNPRLEWFYSERRNGHRNHFDLNNWPVGVQNIEITGVFGYTEPDSSPQGRTPLLIKRATELIVIRDLTQLVDVDTRSSDLNRGRITKLKTRDQEIAYASPSASAFAHQGTGFFTGDPQIDNLLAMFTRPAGFGSA